MLTFTVRRAGATYTATWNRKKLTGDEVLVDLLEDMTAVGFTVEVTPVGPTMVVTATEPRTLLRGFEVFGAVTVEGTWPAPTWEQPSGDVVF